MSCSLADAHGSSKVTVVMNAQGETEQVHTKHQEQKTEHKERQHEDSKQAIEKQLVRTAKKEPSKEMPAEQSHKKEAGAEHKETAEEAGEMDFDEGDGDDVALDELEAMTIASMLLKKNWSPPPKVACVWNLWGEWGDCSATCQEKGVEPTLSNIVHKSRKRTVKTQPAHGGTECTKTCEGYRLAKQLCSHKETTFCQNTPECEGPTAPPTSPPPQNFASRMSAVSLLPLAGLCAMVGLNIK